MGRPKGYKHSEATKKKLSEGKMGDKNSMFRKNFSDEHREKISKALKEHKYWGKGYASKKTRKKTSKSLKEYFKINPQLKGKKSHNWKGGRRKITLGYIEIYQPNHPFNSRSCVLEHRLVMEKHLGRYLTREEIVHHINKITNDNRIENLMLFKNKRAHGKFHIIQEGMKPEEIIFDGRKL